MELKSINKRSKVDIDLNKGKSTLGKSASGIEADKMSSSNLAKIEIVGIDKGDKELDFRGEKKEPSLHEDNEMKLKEATEILNKLLEKREKKIEIERHQFFNNDLMMKIIDKKTGDVVVEVPPKKILDMVAKLCEMAGILIDKKV